MERWVPILEQGLTDLPSGGVSWSIGRGDDQEKYYWSGLQIVLQVEFAGTDLLVVSDDASP